jgi:hypothetical protein
MGRPETLFVLSELQLQATTITSTVTVTIRTTSTTGQVSSILTTLL